MQKDRERRQMGVYCSAAGGQNGSSGYFVHAPADAKRACGFAVFPAVAAISVFMLGRIQRRILGREAMEAPTESVIADVAAAKAGSD
jgi:hypothetical protein